MSHTVGSEALRAINGLLFDANGTSVTLFSLLDRVYRKAIRPTADRPVSLLLFDSLSTSSRPHCSLDTFTDYRTIMLTCMNTEKCPGIHCANQWL